MTVSHRACLRTSAATLLLAACTAASAGAQGFVGLGGGASLPLGSGGESMRVGWMTELMAGMVLPGGFASARVGAMFGESRVDPMMDDMWMGDPLPQADRSRVIGGMAGLMAMPDWDWDWYPYVHAGVGLVNARFQGDVTSFAWSSGAGAVMKHRRVDLYVEGRFLQARRDGGKSSMGSVTTGLRLPL